MAAVHARLRAIPPIARRAVASIPANIGTVPRGLVRATQDKDKKGAGGAERSAREFDDPEVLGLRRDVAGVLGELRSHALDELPGAVDRLQASVVRPLDGLLADTAN